MGIRIEKLSKRYGENQVLKDFSGELSEGRITCIMAPSGRGKTTLLRILMGLEKPDQGRITGLEGRRISAVFQEDRLCENLSAGANIRLVQEKKYARSREFSEKMEEGFKALDLGDCKNQPVRELSGGMKRRIALLRALYASWEVLFLDEPFKGLDSKTKERVIRHVKEESRGRTVLCVTHDPEEARALEAEILEL